MGQPHPVAIFDRGANVLAVDVAVLLRKTGIPQSGVRGLLVRKIRRLFDCMTKTGRTDHRAIRASEASSRHIVPSWMFMGIVQSLRQASVIQSADLASSTGIDAFRRFADQFLRGGRQ